MDLTHRKTILRKIANGLFIVTSGNQQGVTAAMVTFLTQSSFDPPLITMARHHTVWHYGG